MRPAARRVLAAAVALAALAAAWGPFWLGLLSITVSAQRPDPAVPNGDPCCGHPDTWGQVVGGVAYGALVAGVALGPLAVAALAGATVVRGRVPGAVGSARARRLAAVWAVALVASLVLFFGIV